MVKCVFVIWLHAEQPSSAVKAFSPVSYIFKKSSFSGFKNGLDSLPTAYTRSNIQLFWWFLLALARIGPSYSKMSREDAMQRIPTEHSVFYVRSLPEPESALLVNPNLKKIWEKKISTSMDKGGRQTVAATWRREKKMLAEIVCRSLGAKERNQKMTALFVNKGGRAKKGQNQFSLGSKSDNNA